MKWDNEHSRILNAYKDMDERMQHEQHFFVFRDIAHLYRLQRRYWNTLTLFQKMGIQDLAVIRILDIGCGDGNMLRQFLQWGARPENLAGIDLRPEPVDYALSLNPDLDVRCGSAAELPWPDKTFDLVCQHTVFTSVLDGDMRKRIASEMKRVIQENGMILWYDFLYNNPSNPDVRGVRKAEIKQLFPDSTYKFLRITLAPPLARRLVPISWGLSYFLESLKIFNTHYLAAISPLPSQGRELGG